VRSIETLPSDRTGLVEPRQRGTVRRRFSDVDGMAAVVEGADRMVDWAAAGQAVAAVSGKWAIPVLAALAAGPRRHADLRRQLGAGVSDKVLVETLRRMIDAGLIARHTQPGPAAVTEYRLTAAGRALLAPLAAMAVWQTVVAPAARTGGLPT
jgi:DNA-binding HxlR family transcriptional regulator